MPVHLSVRATIELKKVFGFEFSCGDDAEKLAQFLSDHAPEELTEYLSRKVYNELRSWIDDASVSAAVSHDVRLAHLQSEVKKWRANVSRTERALATQKRRLEALAEELEREERKR